MSKKAIWLIIILMTIGLLGSSLIQVYWFNWSMEQQETRFETNVFEALNNVEERLTASEAIAPLELLNSMNDAPSQMIQKEMAEFIEESGMVSSEMRMNLERISDTMYSSELLTSLLDSMDSWRRQSTYWEMWDEQRRYNPPDISERIIPQKLDYLIKEELENHGISLLFQYGVIQSVDSSFIIINGNYVVGSMDDSEATHATYPQSRSLFNSKYHIALFRSDLKNSPGWLTLHFPNKTGWLWYSLLPTLLAAVLFTCLILFCFSYTIYVILRQKKVSSMKTDFINNMTHEFKTPIATISLAADSIASPKVISDEAKINRFVGIIQQENKRMLRQVEKVLQMAQMDEKDFKLKISQVNMHMIIQQAVDHLSLQVQRKEGQITMHLNAEQPMIEGDHTHLSNVIYNMLDNANKYSEGAPEIVISTKNVTDGIEITVTDHGIGMTKEDQKHIFDKFYRVHTGNVHDVKGFGLGLSYVKAIAQAHRGSIQVKSEPGKGSEFCLYLPVYFKYPK